MSKPNGTIEMGIKTDGQGTLTRTKKLGTRGKQRFGMAAVASTLALGLIACGSQNLKQSMVEYRCNQPGYSKVHETDDYENMQSKGELESSDRDGSERKVFFFTGSKKMKEPENFRAVVDSTFVQECENLLDDMEYEHSEREYDDVGFFTNDF